MPVTISIAGWGEFAEKAKNMPDILRQEVDGEVEDSARTWAALAKRDAPVDQGFLRGQISSFKLAIMQAEAVSPADYSAYIEWGTKSRVSVPPQLQSYAAQFRGGINTGGAKKMIYAWMERVGVPKQYQYPTFISIITKGIRPHPFFFIQIPIVEKQLITNVTKILNTPH